MMTTGRGVLYSSKKANILKLVATKGTSASLRTGITTPRPLQGERPLATVAGLMEPARHHGKNRFWSRIQRRESATTAATQGRKTYIPAAHLDGLQLWIIATLQLVDALHEGQHAVC